VIWLALDADGGVTASLRPTAEGDLTDAADEAVDLQRCERIEVAHGSRLPEADGARWGQHLADYELAPLFRQFGRPVPNMSGATGKAIEDRKGCATDAGNLRKIAGRLGYTPGPIDDYPHFSTFVRPFVGAGVVAVVHHSGISSTGDDANAEVTLQHLEFCELVGGQPADPRDIATIPPVLLRESWNDYQESHYTTPVTSWRS
jgi:hypothetical protein